MSDVDPIQELKKLAGISLTPGLNQGRLHEYKGEKPEGSNISYTAQEKVDYQQMHNIQPGTPEWFKLWFSKPYLTGEKPW